MATTPIINTDYLKFDAFSIKSLIKQKLSEDPTFTDHIYDGSNLSILIDIFSNMFQVLLYNLNHTAAESMFTDTQIYENINRLVKFIGYNPRGYSTSNVLINVDYTTGIEQGLIVPPYTSILLNRQDKNGNSVYYSTVDYYYLYSSSTTNNVFPLHNGQWTKYDTVFTSEGLPYEKFILDSLISDSNSLTPTYIAYPYIHVYVKRKINSDTNQYETIRFDPNINGLFIDTENASIFGPTSKVFNLRLNEYKQYEIQFGDGIHGEALKTGDLVYIVYMNSNGPDGIMNLSEITSDIPFKVGIKNINDIEASDNSVLSMDDIIKCLFKDSSTLFGKAYEISNISNLSKSSTPTSEEDVETIKTNAPQWFKSIGRLVTQKDFDYFIRSNFYNDLIDIKISNNWEYICSFYKWLYIRGLSSTVSPAANKYINNNLTSNYGYKYADAADSNNIYVWLKAKSESTSLISEIEEAIRPLKPLTAEIICMYPLRKIFFPCAHYTTDIENYDIENWDNLFENYIEVEIEKNTLLSFEAIKSLISTYITEYFAAPNQKIGNIINLNELNSYILSIDGIKNLRTVYVNRNNRSDIRYINGLSFVCWTKDIINGEDIAITNSTFTLEPFQFAELAPNNLNNYIKLITESSFSTNQIEY